ncbi:sigma E protease regulator RseP [Candidatus Palibaumannia cicadellinicola]|uniref:Zinc metalloprotease n=1 Tax=Baumannia cicadellinicola subsp. Homalodisca coagulata TaxID=374463 RepID=Q1LSV0_BAUCH|nr:sigma E protease regulator RseP [Candidatus Baumannia cicadellinicola]ABF14099.1 protease EcfE [Baumannia cicadellinicola str. Hc (Homalodisca coagulata)]MCJ7462174.1 sigma E protease regulator RseP [Candidatus Baumannia cicadellinicola]MCJ7463000.1 sigma E protease regulator RseP [Candidatus Baumannia cicadellinicola]
MLHFCWSISAFICSLSVLIIVHELGHFWVARCCGVQIDKLSIGLGPEIWSWHDKYGTQLAISAIPLGGYVKMLEINTDIVSSEPVNNRFNKAFNHKHIWQRAIIVAAGPICNFIFAMITYWMLFIIGIPNDPPIINSITPNSIVAQANILPGMEIKSVENVITPNWNAVRLQLLNNMDKHKITICVAPFGSQNIGTIETKVLNLNHYKLHEKNQDNVVALGLIPSDLRIEPIIDKVIAGTAADKAGLQAGDKIIEIDGQSISEWQPVIMKIKDNPGRKLTITIKRHNFLIKIVLTPDSQRLSQDTVEGFAGILPKITYLPLNKYQNLLTLDIFPALLQAIQHTWQIMRLTVSMLIHLINGDITFDTLHGPISIANSAGISAEYGFRPFLMFLALISINVGIINLFPLPILDGGHLLFLIIEKVKGSPISPKLQEYSYYISAILLALFMCISLINDISRL